MPSPYLDRRVRDDTGTVQLVGEGARFRFATTLISGIRALRARAGIRDERFRMTAQVGEYTRKPSLG
jgi:hypothetical protein